MVVDRLKTMGLGDPPSPREKEEDMKIKLKEDGAIWIYSEGTDLGKWTHLQVVVDDNEPIIYLDGEKQPEGA